MYGNIIRMERMDSVEGDSSPHHPDYEGDEGSDEERESPQERKRDHKGREGDSRKSDEEKEDGPDGPGGVQVTIRADGERAVNNEGRGRPRVAGRLFVELRCPHCSNQRSITFKEYKYHLGSDAHKGQLNRLARKHSVVLRKIRVQQRQEQRDIEEKWKEDKAEEFKASVTRFCNTCKLAFKCLGGNIGEGISVHNNSKLHRMQKCYLHPRCTICRITFPSRMVYEYHISSISHLRVRTATMDRMGGSHRSDDQDQEDEDDDLDLANFMTLDAVGEDDEVGSEHEEITGGLDEEEAVKEAESRRKQSLGARYGSLNALDDDEVSVEADWDKEPPEEDEDEEENEAVGSEYVKRIEAYFCSLCSKIIRADTSLGSRAVQRHCRSFDHITHYQDAHPPTPAAKEAVSVDGGDGEDEKNIETGDGNDKDSDEVDEDEAEMEEDPEEEKLWEEVDKGLNMLQDEIMTEIEDSSNVDDKKVSESLEAETEATEMDTKNENTDESESRYDKDEKEEVEEAEAAEDDEKETNTKEHDENPIKSTEVLEDVAENTEEEK